MLYFDGPIISVYKDYRSIVIYESESDKGRSSYFYKMRITEEQLYNFLTSTDGIKLRSIISSIQYVVNDDDGEHYLYDVPLWAVDSIQDMECFSYDKQICIGSDTNKDILDWIFNYQIRKIT